MDLTGRVSYKELKRNIFCYTKPISVMLTLFGMTMSFGTSG